MKNGILILFILLFFRADAQQNLIWNNLYSKPNIDLAIDATTIDSLGNVLILSTATSNFTSDSDPILLKYDPAGNLILNWTSNDSTVRENQGRLAIDSLNNIYIVTYCYDTVSFVRIVKLDGATGQTIYNNTYPGFSSYLAFGLYHDYFYLSQAFPVSEIYKFDLQGNLVSSSPIPFYLKFDLMLFSDNNIYLLGDSVDATSFIKRIDKFDFSGQLLSSSYSGILNIGFLDAFCTKNDDVYYAGIANLNKAVYLHWDSQLILNDSLINLPSQGGCLSHGSETDVYWCYPNLTLMNVLQMKPTISNTFVTDSCLGNGKTCLIIDGNMDLYLFTTIKGSTNFNTDYQITSFNSSGLLNWTFTFTNDSVSRDESYSLINVGAAIYGIGIVDYSSGNSSINIFKISNTTGLDMLKQNNNYVYPNPVSNNSFNFRKRINSRIELYSIDGKLVFETNLQNETKVSLPQSLGKGTYLLNFTDDNLNQTIKIINQ